MLELSYSYVGPTIGIAEAVGPLQTQTGVRLGDGGFAGAPIRPTRPAGLGQHRGRSPSASAAG